MAQSRSAASGTSSPPGGCSPRSSRRPRGWTWRSSTWPRPIAASSSVGMPSERKREEREVSDDPRGPGNEVWSRRLTRRDALKLPAAAAGGAAVVASPAAARRVVRRADTVKVASMFDQTGNLSVYGAQMMDMSKFTNASINKQGGVLGKKLELVARDTQSRIDLYSRYAQELGANKDIVCVVACITSASREATRPVLVDRYGKLLFYPVIYEGGVCDKWVFVAG